MLLANPAHRFSLFEADISQVIGNIVLMREYTEDDDAYQPVFIRSKTCVVSIKFYIFMETSNSQIPILLNFQRI